MRSKLIIEEKKGYIDSKFVEAHSSGNAIQIVVSKVTAKLDKADVNVSP